MPGIFYPRHAARLAVVLEDFSGSATTVDQAVETTVIPRSAKLERNDVHTADRLTLVVDWRECPFDPRLIRAASVAYFAGNIDGGELPLTPATLRFLGVVDVPETYLSEDEQTVTMECRDYTAILLGERARPSMAVPLDRPMDAVLRDLLATLPGEQATLLTPVIQGPDGASIAWPQVPGGDRRGAKLPIEPKDTLWSIIRRIVEAAGLVVFVDLDRLVVSTPRTLGADGELRDAPRVRVAFGEALSDLRMKRNLTNRGKPVALRQYDPRSGDTITSEWPRPGDRARPSSGRRPRSTVTQRRTGGAQVSRDDTTQAEEFTVTGTRSGDELNALAESIYRQRARFDLEGSFTTSDPVLPTADDRGAVRADFDLWSIHTATTLRVEIAELADVAFDSLRSRGDRERYLTARGYSPEIAAALVRSWDQLPRLALPFITRKASLSLDGESGFRAEVDFEAMLAPVDNALRTDLSTAPTSRTAPAVTSLTRGR